MWVEKTKTGYRLCDRVKIDGKTHRVTVPLEKDTPQARRRANEALLEKIRRIECPSSKEGLKTLTEAYIAKKDCKESSRQNTRVALRQILSIIGDASTATEINRKLMESDRNPHTINAYLQLFHAFLRWCYRYGYIEEDIASRLCYLNDKTPKTPDEQKYLEPHELSEVLDHLHGMNYYLCKFLALTGCRIGEAVALTINDIDTHVHINKNLSLRTVTTPKTETSKRDIVIQKELRDHLDEYMKWRKLYMVSKGIRTDLLFFSSRGSYVSKSSLDNALAKIPGKHIHSHMFRHTHVALLAEQGIPLEVISRRLGHNGVGITRDIYYHVTRKQKERDEEMIRDIKIL